MTVQIEQLIADAEAVAEDVLTWEADVIRELIAAIRDADMAQAALVEKAVAAINPHPDDVENDYCPHNVYLVAHPCEECAEARIRALAPDAGVKALAAVQADRDRLADELAEARKQVEALREALTTLVGAVENWAAHENIAPPEWPDAEVEAELIGAAYAGQAALAAAEGGRG